MANTPNAATIRAAQALVTPDDLEDMQKLMSEIEGWIEQAHNDGRIYIGSQYVRLLALVQPEVMRVERRFRRETLAAHRKQSVQLKQEKKLEAEAAQQSA